MRYVRHCSIVVDTEATAHRRNDIRLQEQKNKDDWRADSYRWRQNGTKSMKCGTTAIKKIFFHVRILTSNSYLLTSLYTWCIFLEYKSSNKQHKDKPVKDAKHVISRHVPIDLYIRVYLLTYLLNYKLSVFLPHNVCLSVRHTGGSDKNG